MNHNAALLALTARVAAHPALTHPLAGNIATVIGYRIGCPPDVRIHLAGASRATLGELITWVYLLDEPTIVVWKVNTGSTHVTIHGSLDGDPVSAYAGFYGALAAELTERVDLVDDEAAASVHHLRAVQVGTYRTAVAA